MKNNQHDGEHNNDDTAMPQEVRLEMKNVSNDVEKVPYDKKGQGNSQGNQLEELVKGNTR